VETIIEGKRTRHIRKRRRCRKCGELNHEMEEEKLRGKVRDEEDEVE
jgi:hypothetical protein